MLIGQRIHDSANAAKCGTIRTIGNGYVLAVDDAGRLFSVSTRRVLTGRAKRGPYRKWRDRMERTNGSL